MSFTTEISIDRKSGKSVSSQIAQYLRTQIVSNNLMPGDKLPTTQEFMKKVGVGSHTIRTAISKLEKEGLVKSSPRRGTIVKAFSRNGIQSAITPLTEKILDSKSKKDFGFRRIAIMGAFGSPPAELCTFNAETIEGILQECERLGTVAQIFPMSLRHTTGEKIYNTFVRFGIEGAVWPTPTHNEWGAIEYLTLQNMPVVATRRSRGHDNRVCVESDYDRAGYEVGQFFLKQGCENIFVFPYYEENYNAESHDVDGMFPIGIGHGIEKSYRINSPENNFNITFKKHSGYSEKIISSIKHDIDKLKPNTGVVFTNGYHFLHLLKNHGDEIRTILGDKQFVVLSNYTISVKLAPLMKDLNPMILVDSFKEMGTIATQKLLGRIEGFFSETTVLTKIHFRRFNSLDLLRA